MYFNPSHILIDIILFFLSFIEILSQNWKLSYDDSKLMVISGRAGALFF